VRSTASGFALACVVALSTAASAAEFAVGAGASVDLGTGSLNLGCTDLTVTGTLSAGTAGFTGGRDVTIDPAGTVHGNSGTLQLSGDWDNAGTFNAGTSSVALIDGCSLLSASVFGNSTFNDLQIVSALAKLMSFEAGSTTTVSGDLTLAGQSGALLQIRSTAGGVTALLDAQGSASASFLDVDDNDATAGNYIPLGDESLKGSNTPGWNLIDVVPVVGLFGLVTLAGSMLWLGRRKLTANGLG
jgi:hypothetical protein